MKTWKRRREKMMKSEKELDVDGSLLDTMDMQSNG